MASTKTKEIKNETVDVEKIKKELKDYITIEIKNGFNEELEKANRRLIREKNKKIIVKNIVIIILLAIIGFLVFLLYKSNYFNKYFVSEENNIKEEVKEDNNTVEEEKVKEPTLEEKIEKYSYLLDNIYINSSSEYVEDYFDGKLTDSLKSCYTLNSLNSDDIVSEEEYSVISVDKFKEGYSKLFNDEFNPKTFNYNNNEIRYVSIMKSFISNSVITRDSSDIDRMITDIDVNDKKVTITTVEAYKNNDAEKLSELVYTFNNEILESVSKK